MPPRHHRTVDRVVSILEIVSRDSRGISLNTLSEELEAPKTSIQELTNGLLATGYLVERGGGFRLGAGAFVLTLMANRNAAVSLTHEWLEEIQRRVGAGVMAGIGVGDSLVYIDHVGGNPALEFVARNHSRRSLYSTASGKIILAAMDAKEMDGILLAAPVKERSAVDAFLAELATIRRDRVAFNYGSTLPGVAAVATPLYDSHGVFTASVCVPVDRERESDLPALGEKLRWAVEAASRSSHSSERSDPDPRQLIPGPDDRGGNR